MKRVFFGIALFLISTGMILGQEIEVKKGDYRSKDDYKKAKELIKQGETFYAMDTRGGYRQALDFYLDAYPLNPNNDMLNYKIGKCYLNSIQKIKCIKYFEKAFELNHYIAADIMLMLARGYHLSYKFDKAIEYYKKYKNTLSPKDLQTKRKEIEKYIEECKIGKKLVKKPIRVFIDNVGENINSRYADY